MTQRSRSPRRAEATASPAVSTSPSAPSPAPPAVNTDMADLWGLAYWRDALERHCLFLDTLRQRGNSYQAHVEAGAPSLLQFEHEVVCDGRDLPRPCNYTLVRVLAPQGTVPARGGMRPVVVVDPRAGHGPGIGGFKQDSEVGVAMQAGHPVYFVSFRPQPEEGQTLGAVTQAEATFLEAVIQRHPDAPRPVVIGNCQAGWAMASLAAQRPELFGPLMLVGSPLSYWAGGSQLNPMRYSGAVLGGSWLASLSADLGADRFDGAHLVQNFEGLNPAHSQWGKYYRLWSQVDTESERFLTFERWWGGFFRMTGAEIEAIVEHLFVGNRLARGTVPVTQGRPGEDASTAAGIDLRQITAPVLVFASWGDNITPPPQALNWIIDTWGDERAIAAAGRVIVYVLHERVGHLGIFVGADIARKEHDQIVNSLDVLENLPPGLYEMKVQLKSTTKGGDVHEVEDPVRWDALEPGSYTVNFEHRTMAHLRALNPEGRQEEQLFSTAAQVSEIAAAAYKAGLRPWIRACMTRAQADASGLLHPLRWQRQVWSDAHPLAAWVKSCAEQVRAQRHAVSDDHPLKQWERGASAAIESSLNSYREGRDQSCAHWAQWLYGPWAWGAWLPPRTPDEVIAVSRAQTDLATVRQEVLPQVAQGDFVQAVCRIVLAGMMSIGSFERRSFRLAGELARLSGRVSRQKDGDVSAAPSSVVNWRKVMRFEARVAAVAPVEALNALSEMLPDTDSRERALAMAAAVMMIEPTLNQPRSEIIEWLMGVMQVDPQRVMAQARRMTQEVEREQAPAAKTRKRRTQAAAKGKVPASHRTPGV